MGSIAKAIYLILRDYQKKTLEAYLSGRDVFVSAPTVAGKSLTFELAPYVFDCLNGDQANSYSIALVVVPLISLMKDQVSNLNSRRIPASSVGDDCSEQQWRWRSKCDHHTLRTALLLLREFLPQYHHYLRHVQAFLRTLSRLSWLQWTSSIIRSFLLRQESFELRFRFCLRNFGTKCLSKVNLRHWIPPFR